MASTLSVVPSTRPARYLPGYCPLWFVRGDDLEVPLPFTKNGQVFDASGWVLAAQIRYNEDAEPVLADFSFDDTHSTTGLFIATVSKSLTQGFQDELVWDCQRTADGKTRTILAGPCSVKRDTTRP